MFLGNDVKSNRKYIHVLAPKEHSFSFVTEKQITESKNISCFLNLINRKKSIFVLNTLDVV
jgi:hypothetical protein